MIYDPKLSLVCLTFYCHDLHVCMRRAGQNPTDIEVHDMINKIDNGSGVLDFEDFLLVMGEKNRETDIEIHFKDTFRAFSKDQDGKSEMFRDGYIK